MLPLAEKPKPACHPERSVHSNGLCKPCYLRQWRVENPTKHRGYKLKETYGLSLQDFDDLLKAQDNCCAICTKKFIDNERPVVDHKHGTKIVRGLVHYWCNTRLPAIEDNEFLENALRYLEDARRKENDQAGKV